MRITLQAFSSSGESYPVEFTDEKGVLRVFCHCQAGQIQQMCEHKVALLKGDSKMLYEASDEPMLKQVLNCPAYGALKTRLDEYEGQLAEVERERARVKEREEAIKREFGYELTHGKRHHISITKTS